MPKQFWTGVPKCHWDICLALLHQGLQWCNSAIIVRYKHQTLGGRWVKIIEALSFAHQSAYFTHLELILLHAMTLLVVQSNTGSKGINLGITHSVNTNITTGHKNRTCAENRDDRTAYIIKSQVKQVPEYLHVISCVQKYPLPQHWLFHNLHPPPSQLPGSQNFCDLLHTMLPTQPSSTSES